LPSGQDLPPPTAAFTRFVATATVDWSKPDSVVQYLLDYSRILAGDERRFDENAFRDLVQRDVERAHDIAASQNHDLLVDDEPTQPTHGGLSSITVPTLVIHGTADPMFPLPHGEVLAEQIPTATLLSLPGGHGVDPADWATVTRAILEHTSDLCRISDIDFYDAELRLLDKQFRAAVDVRSHDRVLDVGCGTGRSARAAARVAVAGSVLGVDLSPPMLERARQLTEDEGLPNVAYQQADAEVHPFPAQHFDLCISRFGTMFFSDPVAAFGNIGNALRPGARLVLLVWQEHDRNEWATAIRTAVTGTAAPYSPTGPGPFALADPSDTEDILATAGFVDIDCTDVREPVYYGPNVDAAYDAVLRLQEPRNLLATLATTLANAARQRLRATLAAHDTGNGVYFDARAWIVTARRP
jgi:SAM-dependent methyltransferase